MQEKQEFKQHRGLHYGAPPTRRGTVKRDTTIRIEGSIAYAPLTQGKWAIIDVSSVEIVAPYNWYCMNGYACAKVLMPDGAKTKIYIHNLIYHSATGIEVLDGWVVNHRDCDPLNNLMSNLELASRRQDACRRTVHVHNGRDFGLSYNISRNLWELKARIRKKQYCFSWFKPSEYNLALLARDLVYENISSINSYDDVLSFRTRINALKNEYRLSHAKLQGGIPAPKMRRASLVSSLITTRKIGVN